MGGKGTVLLDADPNMGSKRLFKLLPEKRPRKTAFSKPSGGLLKVFNKEL